MYEIQQQLKLAHIFNQPPIICLQEGKITQGLFSSRITSFNPAAIKKRCKQRSIFKRFVLKSEGNLHMIFC